MATTVYSTETTHDGISYRAKVDYTITTNLGTVVVSAAIQMQYKGKYAKSSSSSVPGKICPWAHNTYVIFDPPEEYQVVRGTYYNINASNFPSKTAWTNKGSALSVTITLNKTTTDRTENVYLGIDGESQSGESSWYTAGDSNYVLEVSVPALQSWPVLYMSNNGSSEVFFQKAKYYNKNLYLGYDFITDGSQPPVLPTRSGYVPRTDRDTSLYQYAQVFNTAADGSGTRYDARVNDGALGYGDTYTENQPLTLYLMWASYINYDGNGISLSSYTWPRQTKPEHESIVLNSNTLTRSGYMFKEWNTAADGTGTAYSPGDTYSADVGHITLYAIWLTMPTNPQIGNMTAIRSNAQGQQDDTGTYASVSADWSVDTTSEAYPQNTGTVTGTITPQSTGVEQSFTFSSGSSGTSGTAVALISGLDTDEQYLVKVTVTDQVTSTSKTVILTRAFFIMDFKAGGKGIGIGRAAPDEGLEIGYEATFDDDVTMLEKLHAHVTDQATIANGDKLLFSDSSDNGKIVRASVTFDGSSADQVLSRKGTWEQATDVPTANKIAKFDSSVHINSKDMTSQEISDFVNGLNLSGGAEIETTQADWIVEQGVDGIWTWRKWQSGIAECWGDTGVISLTNYTTTLGGNGYGYTTSVTFPSDLFVSVPILTYSAFIGNGFGLTGTLTNASLSNTSAKRSLYAVGNSSGTKDTRWLVEAKGRWK